MNLFSRTLGFAGMVALTLIACKYFSNPVTNPQAGVIVWLPSFYDGSFGDEVTMGEEEKRWLPKDTTFMKLQYPRADYMTEVARLRSIGGADAEKRADNLEHWAANYGVGATIIVAGSDSRSLHRPQVCLVAQGWSIEKRVVHKVETKGGQLEVMDFHLAMIPKLPDGNTLKDQTGNPVKYRAHYFYWWVGPDATTPYDEKRVWLETWNSILKGRRERWAYPSVMTWVNEADGDDSDRQAVKRALNFISEVAPEFQKSLGAKDRADAVKLKSISAE